MGRKRQRDRHLPPCVYFNHGAYYLVKAGVWKRLGSTKQEIYKALAEMARQEDAPLVSMSDLFDRYSQQVIPEKKAATQRSNLNSLQYLRAFFGTMRIDEVESKDCFEYRDIRGQVARIGVNRDLEVLSHAFSKAIEWGVIRNESHPMRGLRLKNSAPPRDRYVTDEDINQALTVASDFLKSYIGLKLLTGLSKGDMLSIRLEDLADDGIHYQRRKTAGRGAKHKCITWTPELQTAVASCKQLRKNQIGSLYLFATRTGSPYIDEEGNTSGFDSIWQRFMAKVESLGVERFTEHDLRAKVASDTTKEHAQALLDHASGAITERVYRRGRVDVSPIKPRLKNQTDPQ